MENKREQTINDVICLVSHQLWPGMNWEKNEKLVYNKHISGTVFPQE